MYYYSCCCHFYHYYYTPSFQVSVTSHSNNSELTIINGNFQKHISPTEKICFQSSTRLGHSFISLQKFYRKCYEDLPPDRPSVGVVVPPPVGSTLGLFPLIETTLKFPSFPSFVAPLSVTITSCSFIVELNFSARLTMILPHLGTEINLGLE